VRSAYLAARHERSPKTRRNERGIRIDTHTQSRSQAEKLRRLSSSPATEMIASHSTQRACRITEWRFSGDSGSKVPVQGTRDRRQTARSSSKPGPEASDCKRWLYVALRARQARSTARDPRNGQSGKAKGRARTRRPRRTSTSPSSDPELKIAGSSRRSRDQKSAYRGGTPVPTQSRSAPYNELVTCAPVARPAGVLSTICGVDAIVSWVVSPAHCSYPRFRSRWLSDSARVTPGLAAVLLMERRPDIRGGDEGAGRRARRGRSVLAGGCQRLDTERERALTGGVSGVRCLACFTWTGAEHLERGSIRGGWARRGVGLWAPLWGGRGGVGTYGVARGRVRRSRGRGCWTSFGPSFGFGIGRSRPSGRMSIG